MRMLEEMKKYEFNTKQGKTNYMKMKNNKNEPEELQLHVKQGEIKPTEHYKYLGDVYDTKASNVEKIKNRMQEISYMANEVKQQGSYQKVETVMPK